MIDEVVNLTGNVSWNTSMEELLLLKLGPRSKDIVSAAVLTIVYSLIFLSGSTGNICTCIVIVRNHCMQTTTNYYLFSLAVSDLLLLFFGLPPELFSIWMAYPWRFGEAFCYLRSTILELTSYASVLTITAFTVERYIAVCRPLLSHKMALLSRTVKIIVVIWIVSVLVALPYAAHTRLYHAVTLPPDHQPVADSLVCSIPKKWLEGRMTYMFQISTFLFFLAPVTLIICLYILIGIAVRRSPLSRASSDDHRHSHVKNVPLPQQPRRVVIRMLVAVTVAFIICWAPFHTQRLMVLYVRQWTPELLDAQSHIFYISGVLYFVSATVNPILYNVISRRYRVAFKETIFGPCLRHKSGASRQRLNSNTMNRQAHYGDTACFQQCSLLGKSSPGRDQHRRPGNSSCVGADVPERRESRRCEVKGSAGHLEHLASSLCPDILMCNRVQADKTDAAADEEGKRLRREDVKDIANGCSKLVYVHADKVNKLSSLHYESGPSKLKHKDSVSVDIAPTCRLSDFDYSANSSDPDYGENCLEKYGRSSSSDSNCNSESDESKWTESVKQQKKADSALKVCSQDGKSSRSSVSHQRGLARPSGTSTSLCKQCLTNISTPKGSAPCGNGVDAYCVTYNVNKPLTLV